MIGDLKKKTLKFLSVGGTARGGRGSTGVQRLRRGPFVPLPIGGLFAAVRVMLIVTGTTYIIVG